VALREGVLFATSQLEVRLHSTSNNHVGEENLPLVKGRWRGRVIPVEIM
jgi:hypothetical protein